MTDGEERTWKRIVIGVVLVVALLMVAAMHGCYQAHRCPNAINVELDGDDEAMERE